MALATATIVALSLATAAVGGSVHAREQVNKAGRESTRQQLKSFRVSKATAAVERSISRRKAVAETRRRQASNISEGANIGILGSSPLQGSLASISSSLSTGLAGQQRSFASGQQIFDLRQSAAFTEAAGARKAGTTQALSGLATTGASISASFI